jgi:lauroyl/myristoyl acyltransferase
MNTLLYYFASGLITALQSLPLDTVARIGRFFGGLVYYLDARHRRVARRNLAMCFPEKSPHEIRALARENFIRVGENFACAVKTASLEQAQLEDRIEVHGTERLFNRCQQRPSTSIIVAIGHFGNFEVYGRLWRLLPAHQGATTYRAVRNPAIDRLLLRLRQSTGCLYFERRSEGGALRTALRGQNLMLGLLTDQHSGDHGLRLPFLGHDCNVTKAPAVFALRFNAPLFVSICYRTRLAHWRVEVSDEIPTLENGEPRPLEAIMGDVNRVFEAGIRKDPANWFWVHNRWKQSRLKASAPKNEADDSESAASDSPTGSAA